MMQQPEQLHQKIIWYKKDVKLFLVLIPLVNLANYLITYSNIEFNAYFLATLLVDTAQGYITWLLVRYVIVRMELHVPLLHFTFKRVVLQLLLTSVVGLVFIICATEILNAIAKDTPVPPSFYELDIWIYLIWILVINAIYIGWYYYLFWKKSEEKLDKQSASAKQTITVTLGNRSAKIPLHEVSAFYVDSGVTFLLDHNNQTYTVESSLNNLEEQLSDVLFYRVNRKFILHRNVIQAYSKIENKKLLLSTVSDVHLPEQVQVSRLKAAEFKNWFEQQAIPL